MKREIQGIIIALIIFSIILVSGCTQEAKTDSNNGIMINEFTADQTDVDENEPVVFYLEVQNMGETTAENVKSDLLGVKEIWRGTPPATKEMNSMGPPTQYRAGDVKVAQWTLTPPDLPEGIVQTFPVTARTTFHYATNSFIIMKTISEDQYDVILGKDEEITDTLIVDNTDGPLKVDFVQGPLPIVVDPSDDIVEVPVRFKIENYGAGWPIKRNDATGNEVGKFHVKIKVAGSGTVFAECENAKETDTAEFDRILREDKTSSISCIISVDKERFKTTLMDAVTFSFEITYDYYVEQTINVVVHGKKAGTPGSGTTPPGSGTTCVIISPGGTPSGGTTQNCIEVNEGACYAICVDNGAGYGTDGTGLKIYYDNARCYKASWLAANPKPGNPKQEGNQQCEGLLGAGAKCYCLNKHKACGVGIGEYFACVNKANGECFSTTDDPDEFCNAKDSADPANTFGHASAGDYYCKKILGANGVCCCSNPQTISVSASGEPFTNTLCKNACQYISDHRVLFGRIIYTFDGVNDGICREIGSAGKFVVPGNSAANQSCQNTATNVKKYAGDWTCFCGLRPDECESKGDNYQCIPSGQCKPDTGRGWCITQSGENLKCCVPNTAS